MINKVYLSSNKFYDKIPAGTKVSLSKDIIFKNYKYTYSINIKEEYIKWSIMASISSDNYLGILKKDVSDFYLETSF